MVQDLNALQPGSQHLQAEQLLRNTPAVAAAQVDKQPLLHRAEEGVESMQR